MRKRPNITTSQAIVTDALDEASLRAEMKKAGLL